MSDWGSVVFCYDYERESRPEGAVRCKGLISKAYKYEEAPAMILHAFSGMRYFLDRREDTSLYGFHLDKDRSEISLWAALNTAFDVFFESGFIRPGFDSVKYVLDHWDQNQWKYKSSKGKGCDSLKNDLFNCEGMHGFLYIRYTGSLQDGYELKYGYYYRDMMRDIRGALDEYTKEQSISPDTKGIDFFMKKHNDNPDHIQDDFKDIITFFDENATLFASQEEFWDVEEMGADIIRGVMEPEEEHVYVDPDSIDALNISVRAYACLKRNGVNTIDELKKIPDTKLRALRGVSKRVFEEIRERLSEHEKQNGIVDSAGVEKTGDAKKDFPCGRI